MPGGEIITLIQKYLKTPILSVLLFMEGLYTYIMNTIDFHWDHESKVVNNYFAKNIVKDTSGSGGAMSGGLITTIIGLVIAFRVFTSIMPATITDTKAVVADNGTGAGWDDSEKAMWGLISLLMIVFGIFIALSAMKQRG